MFFIYKVISKFFKLLRIIGSDESPNKTSLGMVFGFFWGMIPLFEPINFILLIVVFVFKISFRGCLLMLVPSLLLSFIIAPFTDSLGEWVLQYPSFRWFFENAYNSYLVLLNFNNTYVMGSFVLGVVLAVPLFFLLRGLTIRYRKDIQQKLVASSFYKKYLSKIWFVKEIITGEQDETKILSGETKTSKVPLDFKTMLPIVLVVGLVIFGFVRYFDITLKSIAELAVTKFNQAPVRIGSLTTSFINSKIAIRQVNWVDRSDFKNNLFQFDLFSGDVLLFPLLQKKVVAEQIRLDGLKFNRSNEYYPETDYVNSKTTVQEREDTEISKTIEESVDQSVTSVRDKTFASGKKVVGQVEKAVNRQLDTVKNQVKKKEAALKKQVSDLEDKYRVAINEQKKNFDFQEELKILKNINVNNIKSLNDVTSLADKLKKLDAGRQKINLAKVGIAKLQVDAKRDQAKLQSEVREITDIKQLGEAEMLKVLNFTGINQRGVLSGLLGSKMTDGLYLGYNYYQKYKSLVPKPNKAEQEATRKEAEWKKSRRAGRLIHYRDDYAYPDFLIKKIVINGVVEENGLVKGEIKSLSSDLSYKPFQTKLDFKYDNLLAHLDGNIVWRNDQVEQRQKIFTEPFPIKDLFEVSPNPLVAGVATGTGVMKGDLVDEGNELKLKLRLEVTGLGFAYKAGADKKIVQAINSAVKSAKEVVMNLTFRKKNDAEPVIEIKSNLDKILEKAMKAYLNGVFNEQKISAQKRYREEIGKLDDKLGKALGKKDLLKNADKYIKDTKSLEQDINRISQKINQIKQGEKEKIRREVENKVKNEVKKFLPKKFF